MKKSTQDKPHKGAEARVAVSNVEATGRPPKKCRFAEALGCTGIHPRWKWHRHRPRWERENHRRWKDVPILPAAQRGGRMLCQADRHKASLPEARMQRGPYSIAACRPFWKQAPQYQHQGHSRSMEHERGWRLWRMENPWWVLAWHGSCRGWGDILCEHDGTEEDENRYSLTKTKVGQKWYQSLALSLLFGRWYFLFSFKGTLFFKVYKTGFSISWSQKLALLDQCSILCNFLVLRK